MADEKDMQRLLKKFDGWIAMQPEWVLIIGEGDRAARKALGAALARRITRIPTTSHAKEVLVQQGSLVVPMHVNREARRQAQSEAGSAP